jgi:hypothetical protein
VSVCNRRLLVSGVSIILYYPSLLKEFHYSEARTMEVCSFTMTDNY